MYSINHTGAPISESKVISLVRWPPCEAQVGLQKCRSGRKKQKTCNRDLRNYLLNMSEGRGVGLGDEVCLCWLASWLAGWLMAGLLTFEVFNDF